MDKEYYRKYRAEHREHIRERDRRYRAEHGEQVRANARKSYARRARGEPDRENARESYARRGRVRAEQCRELHEQILELLGGAVCARCGFTDIRALQIDHIDGNGKQDRKLYKQTIRWYKHILEAGGSGLQVLCANCNWIKRHENGESGGANFRFRPPKV